MTNVMGRRALSDILKTAAEARASDVHLVTGAPPMMRVAGDIARMPGEPLAAGEIDSLLESVLSEHLRSTFREKQRLCVSLLFEGVGYSRVTLYRSKGNVEAAFRLATRDIASLSSLGLPNKAGELLEKRSGLILVTGATGTGKTTTLNSMINTINGQRRAKIVTLEDPIEYYHEHRKSIVVQQEMLTDFDDFNSGLIHVLRQDPDIIVVGEMRDLGTITTTLLAADTGHLVLATLHTQGATGSVDRIVDAFPLSSRSYIAAQLSSALVAVISQLLLPTLDGKSRVLAYEVLIANKAVKNIIREGKIQTLDNTLVTGASEGMISMDRCLKELYQRGAISYDTAIANVRDPRSFRNI
ncbi:MAG: PilT/PilU family type 4a pilus ATPase [Candidatus Coatesbacteria bacterium]|nr:PilT/PilU family type 4a pilus ATPase [Candidatus Coatesbacteria bacterium]